MYIDACQNLYRCVEGSAACAQHSCDCGGKGKGDGDGDRGRDGHGRSIMKLTANDNEPSLMYDSVQ